MGACASLAKRLATLAGPWEALDQVELAKELRRQEEELRHKAEAEAAEARNRIALWAWCHSLSCFLL